MDVHYGAIGSGVAEGTLVKVIGTSTCDCGVVLAGKQVPAPKAYGNRSHKVIEPAPGRYVKQKA